jgi:hypothetical protein
MSAFKRGASEDDVTLKLEIRKKNTYGPGAICEKGVGRGNV